MTKGLQAYNAARTAAKLRQPVGLTYDILYEVRAAMRRLRKVEAWIVREHKAEKRRRLLSGEWEALGQITGKGGKRV